MREIKFRAWHKNRKTFLDFYWAVDKLGRTFSILDKYVYDKFTNEVELMQYTGLKDMNGVEIYEGDILQDPDDEGFCYEVEYDYGRFSCGDNDLIDCLGCNVVGNRFDNPELLEAD
ncbi:YopX family protein [Latilactobacillus curvatus]|uniref:YopX family protein n=1 Tax=Latilactobacillus curvatus TaxID=28038 RepID=UPI0005803633|nr:YopX family protein [Latilactobacillus curvatus]